MSVEFALSELDQHLENLFSKKNKVMFLNFRADFGFGTPLYLDCFFLPHFCSFPDNSHNLRPIVQPV